MSLVATWAGPRGQRSSKHKGPKKGWGPRARPSWNMLTSRQRLDLPTEEGEHKVERRSSGRCLGWRYQLQRHQLVDGISS